VTRGRPRVVERGVGSIGAIGDDPRSPWPDGFVEFDDISRRSRARGSLLSADVGGSHRHEVLHATTEDVARCCHQLQGNAFGALMNDTVELRTAELYSALGDTSVEHGEAYLT
jgi:hypothetical protein